MKRTRYLIAAAVVLWAVVVIIRASAQPAHVPPPSDAEIQQRRGARGGATPQAPAQPAQPALPAPTRNDGAMGWGCFVRINELGGIENWPAHVAVMKEAGMNTFVLLDWQTPGQLRTYIDTAIEQGMLECDVPVVTSCNAAFAQYEGAIGKEEWAAMVEADGKPSPGWSPGQATGTAALIAIAREGSPYSEQWPEFVAYGIDEPGHGEGRDFDLETLIEIKDGWNAAGLRITSAVIYPYDRPAIPALDIVMVCSIIGHDLPGTKAAIAAAGKEFWTYHTGLRGATPSAIRYHVGVWTWQTGQVVNLNWDWAGMLGGDQDMTAPHMNDRLRAFAEGVKDYKWLAATEARLAELRAMWDGDYMPMDWYTAYPLPRQDYAQSPVDFDKLLPQRGQ